MSSNFDWRAEDDHTWDEYSSPGHDDGKKPSGGKRPTLFIILGILVAVIVAGTFAYFQIRRYVDNTAASVEEDVLSSHALVKLAAEENDLELLAPLLSGRDPKWTQDQLTLLDMDLLLERQPFGLFWQPKETAEEITIDLSPDLQSAEVEYTETYGYGLKGEEGEIQLIQTAVYRLSETRWLLSPPADDFWGIWISSKGRYLTLTYPERDDELGQRLASDLEATLAAACQTLDLACEDQPLDVLLATDLEAMMGTGSYEHLGQSDDQLVLPTPTLVGKPANNASYRALYRAYATFLVARLVSTEARWDCCDQSVFFKALLDVQLQQLGLQTWPLKREDYRLALRQPVELATIRTFWEDEITLEEMEERPDAWMLYSFIEYLLNRPTEHTSVDLQRYLARTNSFNTWLTDTGITGSLNLAEQDWQTYSLEQVEQYQQQPPLAWPEEDIALICNDGQLGIANVYRYDLAQNKWDIEIGDRDFVVMNALPDNQGIILTEEYLDIDQLRTTLWRDGQETIVSFGSAFLFSDELVDPTGRYLVVNLFRESDSGGGFESDGTFLLELETCVEGSCPLIDVAWRPTWSPDGSQTLWVIPRSLNPTNEDQIFLGDAILDSGEVVTVGSSPFWLDNETFAYRDDVDSDVMMAMNINETSQEPIIALEELAMLLPEVEVQDLQLNDARTDPLAPDLIILTVANRLDNVDYVFTYDWRTNEKNLILTVENSFGGLIPFNFSPDSRWQLFTTIAAPPFGSVPTRQEFFIYDKESQETQRFKLHNNMTISKQSWTNDGRWLLSLGQDFLILIAPEASYDHFVPFEFRNCTGAVWIQ